MRARGDQADVPALVAAAAVILADGQQPCVLPLRSRVGLQAHLVVAGDGDQPLLQRRDEFPDAFGVGPRCERMQPGETGPGDGLHLGDRVELHRARTERDHAAVQGNVFVRQGTQVAHHGGLGVVAVERRMGQIVAGPGLDRLRESSHVVAFEHTVGLEGPQYGRHIIERGGLIARDRDQVTRDQAQIHVVMAFGPRDDRTCLAGCADGDGVEEPGVLNPIAGRRQAVGQLLGPTMGTSGDGSQALGSVVRDVHRRHDREQDLRRADVTGGLLPADVLLTGLQRQPVGHLAVCVLGHTHQASGHLPGMRGVHRQVAGVRPAEPHRHTESLRRAEADVGALLTGRCDQRQCQQIRAHGHHRTTIVGLGDDRRRIDDPSRCAGHLQDDAEEVALGQTAPRQIRQQRRLDHLNAQRLCPRLDDRARLWEQIGIDHQTRRPRTTGPAHQRHRLGRRRRLIEHRGVGHLETGQVRHHRLEVQQRLQPALADLGLIRRVRRVPGRILQHIAHDHRRCMGVVVAEPDHRSGHDVAVGQVRQMRQDLVLGHRLVQGVEPIVRGIVGDHGGHHQRGEFVERRHTQRLEDHRGFGLIRSYVAVDERLGHRRKTPLGSGRRQRRPVSPPPLSCPDRVDPARGRLRVSGRHADPFTVGGRVNPITFQRRRHSHGPGA